MANQPAFDPELIRGLKALVATTFPKTCRCCGRTFRDVADYVAQTEALPNGRAGFKQSTDDDGTVIVDLFRNCPCGSTLMDSFTNRRDHSAAGEARRQRFGDLLAYLIKQGLSANTAHREMLLVLRGGRSAILSKLRPPVNPK
ncbi:MAG: oxidoreductase [Dechloromonas sp.]|nr:oxidoreductase [Dechloromonas sp.]